MSKEESLARVQSMKSERIFLEELSFRLIDQLEIIENRIKLINQHISAEIKYAETIKTKKAARKKRKA